MSWADYGWGSTGGWDDPRYSWAPEPAAAPSPAQPAPAPWDGTGTGSWDDPRYSWPAGTNMNPGGNPPPADAPAAPAPPPPAAPAPTAPAAPAAPPTTGIDPITGLPTGTAPGEDQGSRDALDMIKRSLGNWNFSQVQIDSLSSFAWSELVNGRAESEVMQDLWQRDEFKERFPAIFERSAKGLPPISPQEYVALEGTYSQLVHGAGLPAGVFDKPEDFHSWIANDRSPQEIKEVLQEGWARVTQAPPAVRAAFGAFYGDQGDSWLASLFLDDKQTVPVLEQHARAAQFAGTAVGFGLGVGRGTAENIAQLGLSDYRQNQILDEARQLVPLTSETASEGHDLTGEDAIRARAGLDPSLFDEFQRRQQNRAAAFAGGGGALMSRQGLAGVGDAQANQ